MLTLTAFLRMLPLAALILATAYAVSIEMAVAQSDTRAERSGGVLQKPHRGPAIGGTSWTLSDVWGVPKMPQNSKDSPGYDYGNSGYELNGPPSQSPYPN